MKTIKTYDEFLNENLNDSELYAIANNASHRLKYYYDKFVPLHAAMKWMHEYLLIPSESGLSYEIQMKLDPKSIEDLKKEAMNYASKPWPSAKQIMKEKTLKVLNGEKIR